MSQPIIEARNLSKRYQLGAIGATSLREEASRLWDRVRGIPHPDTKEFWALRDVSFDIQPGEVVGVIGRNGAGKSTLLKILSRITEPTSGTAKLRGRVASLLEVGTGFHPELTGRENVFLNGAILGMTRAEVRRKFDEIVAFAEVDQFIDTPVKRYSSGMYVRLAFAVAAHLEPEILIIDEVLAVGDASFQEKCLGKMQDVAAHQGRTVIFVSHQMEAIDRLTNRCIYLKNGAVKMAGPTNDAVTQYLSESVNGSPQIGTYRSSSIPDSAQVIEIWAENQDGHTAAAFRQGAAFRLCVRLHNPSLRPIDVAIVVENSRQHPLFTTHLTDRGKPLHAAGEHSLRVSIERPLLRRGRYLISVALFTPDRLSFFDTILHFPLFEISGTLDAGFPDDNRWGDLYLPLTWTP